MENELKDITSKRIKELRTKSDLTMEALAKKIGVSKSTIAKWENGYVDNMRQDMIMKLANVFNVSPLYILGYNEEETSREETFKLLYAQLSDEQKTVVDNLLTTFLSKQ
jgi:transcriptional regulator with XRE-family HTH domain